MTDIEIYKFISGINPNATQGDIDAFRRLINAFDCADAETPKDAHERILASLESISEDLETVDDRLEQQAIINRRIKFSELR